MREPRGSKRRIGKYSLIRKLGEGAAGETWLAREDFTGRDVALKLYKGHPYSRELLAREIMPLLTISHENVVRFLDFNYFEADGDDICYLTMEFIAGGNPRDVIASHPRGITPENAITICQQILLGLAACHNKNIIHRDIKPENILIDGNRVKLGDLGLACEGSLIGTPLGTPAYMAPEQINRLKRHTSKRSDIWSVGVVLYELIHGRLPFSGFEEVIDPGFPPAIETTRVPPATANVLRQSLAKEETARYQSAESFWQALQGCLQRGVEFVMRVEQGVVGWDYDGNSYPDRWFDITFSKEFKTPPVLHTSIESLDIYTADATTRYFANVEEVTTTGAKLHVLTWSNGKLYGCKIRWLALRE